MVEGIFCIHISEALKKIVVRLSICLYTKISHIFGKSFIYLIIEI